MESVLLEGTKGASPQAEDGHVDVANEFVQMIEAQNGFQANARTISVANDILRELSTLIR